MDCYRCPCPQARRRAPMWRPCLATSASGPLVARLQAAARAALARCASCLGAAAFRLAAARSRSRVRLGTAAVHAYAGRAARAGACSRGRAQSTVRSGRGWLHTNVSRSRVRPWPPPGSPFTFDGFPFGFGGISPVDRGAHIWRCWAARRLPCACAGLHPHSMRIVVQMAECGPTGAALPTVCVVFHRRRRLRRARAPTLHSPCRPRAGIDGFTFVGYDALFRNTLNRCGARHAQWCAGMCPG